MVEIVASNSGIAARSEELERLVACNLSLNGEEHHDCILLATAPRLGCYPQANLAWQGHRKDPSYIKMNIMDSQNQRDGVSLKDWHFNRVNVVFCAMEEHFCDVKELEANIQELRNWQQMDRCISVLEEKVVEIQRLRDK